MNRAARLGSGFGLILTGTALLVLPGPGIVTIAAGLAVLSKEYAWAGDTLHWMRGRYRRILTGKGRTLPGEGGEQAQEGG